MNEEKRQAKLDRLLDSPMRDCRTAGPVTITLLAEDWDAVGCHLLRAVRGDSMDQNEQASALALLLAIQREGRLLHGEGLAAQGDGDGVDALDFDLDNAKSGTILRASATVTPEQVMRWLRQR